MTPTERLAGMRALIAAGLPDDALDEAIAGLYRAARGPGKARSPGAERQRRWRERLASVSPETPGDAHETSRRDASETLRDVSRDASAEPRARSLETSSSLLGSGSDSQKGEETQTPQPSVGTPNGPALGRDASRDASAVTRDGWGLTPPGLDPDDMSTIGAKPKAGTKADREARGSRCPKSDAHPAEVVAWLADRGIPALADREHGAEVLKFLDFHRAKGTRSLDWGASWRTWRANAKRWGGRSGPGPREPSRQGGIEDLRAYEQRQRELAAITPDEEPFDEASLPDIFGPSTAATRTA